MNKLDLRQIGTVMGVPIYVEVASIPDIKHEDELLSQRDLRVFQVESIIREAFKVNSDVPFSGNNDE